MKMGGSQMGSGRVPLEPSRDSHVLWARVPFGMEGAWTIRVRYGASSEIDQRIIVKPG